MKLEVDKEELFILKAALECRLDMYSRKFEGNKVRKYNHLINRVSNMILHIYTKNND